MQSIKGPYQTPDGTQWVSPPFVMSVPFDRSAEETIQQHAPLVELARQRAGLSPADVSAIESGRGTPDQIRTLTQALIDMSGHPEGGGPWTPLKIRALMLECGVGIDCAGFTQQAYLAARGQTRAQAGFGPLANESLSHLGQRGFTRVSGIESVRSGDIMALGPRGPNEYGHRGIVYETHQATSNELTQLYLSGVDAQDFAKTIPIYVLEVDSSWGASGRADYGGVQRQTLLYSGLTGQWARLVPASLAEPDPKPVFALTTGPYNHPLEGFYRAPAVPGQP
jgi:hypothetical protein